MSRFRSRFLCCALLTSGAALLVTAGCGQEELPPELPPRAIQSMRVSTSLANEQRVISGVVTAVSETQLAFEVGGSVKTVDVKLGDQVKEGQVLAKLDPEPFELAVNDARATLGQEVALRKAANAEFSRTQKLFEANVKSRQELDRATALRDSHKSQVEAAEAHLDRAQRDLRRSVLIAPFSGSISVRAIEPAMEVAGGQVVFEMDSAESGLRVEVQMPETLIESVRQGAEVGVGFPSLSDARFEDSDRRYPGVVSEVGTRAGVGNAFPVRVDLDGQPSGVRPGMTAEVFFSIPRAGDEIASRKGVMIPIAAALAQADDQFSVFVFDPETKTVHERPIRTGGIRDNDIAVLEGLSDGDVIATAGVSFLRDGQEVTLLDERTLRADR